jgi:ABC-type transport system involved in cytochrome bd biosynthesis fused ATPase/permease subunit
VDNKKKLDNLAKLEGDYVSSQKKVSRKEMNTVEMMEEIKAVNLGNSFYSEEKGIASKRKKLNNSNIERIRKIIPPSRTNLNADENILELKDLEISFYSSKKPVKVVRGVSLTLKPGEIVGIVGESGSGKSASVKSLVGMNSGSKTTVSKMNITGNDYSYLYDKESKGPQKTKNTK